MPDDLLEAAAKNVMTMADLGRHLGLAPATIRGWKRRGMPVRDDGLIELDAVMDWADVHGDKRRRPKSPALMPRGETTQPAPDEEGRDWAQTYRKTKALSEIYKLKELQGRLVEAERVREWMTGLALEVRKHHLEMEKRLAPQLEGLSAREIARLLAEYNRALLQKLSGTMPTKTTKKTRGGGHV